MRRSIQIFTLGTTILAGGLAAIAGNAASALQYQSNPVPLTFDFDTSMTVTLSGNALLIDQLSPNTTKNSNTVDITVVTNDASGYTLRATTGSTANASTNLVSSNGTFSMIGNAVTALSAGEWGYTTNGGTTFGNLPLYTATPKVVNSSEGPTGPSESDSGLTSFQIGAYASASQAQGDYTNVVNFTAVANTVEANNMQNYTLSQCATDAAASDITLYDSRDNKSYTVRYINGECWMTQNLRYTGTNLSTTSSNVAANTTLTYYSLDSTDSSYTDHCDSTNGYNYACIKDSGVSTTGVWYNYYAATAGTIGTNSNTDAATSDICPAGWHLPSGPNTTADTDFNKLVGNTTSGWQAATTGFTAFSATAGGSYDNGSLAYVSGGRWWSSTTGSVVTGRYDLGWDSGQFYANGNIDRRSGAFIRCVKSE